MHRLLKRQVKQVFGKDFDIKSFDAKTLELLERVGETYHNFDKEKNFLNHTVNKNKRELKEAYSSMIISSRLAGIGEMMENITHQWKQPLSIILNLIALLKLELKDNRELEIIEEQTKYLDKTITDFKSFSSHSDEEKSLFELEKSIDETIKLFTFQAKLNRIVVNKNLEKGLLQQGNMGKFNQALLVIFANAKDAFLGKNIINRIIEIETKSTDNAVVITIQDNAGGVLEKNINKSVEPDFTTKFKAKCTGIGLSMTYNIIKEMKGTIRAKNCKNGALFFITLPKYNKQKDSDE
jgi:C4-dicarboxylate-specific signal transduction histidine kinase